MDLNWLDDVLVLLEERNMTRAAARRNITQPAFSRRIRSFEDWLGSKILERRSNKIEISQALLANEDELRALVTRLREMRTSFSTYAPGQSKIAIAAQHAPVVSTFPDMALHAKTKFPSVSFRIRSGNLYDCVSLFLRGDTAMLLCYEAENLRALEFGAGVRRGSWGADYLVPVVGGTLRSSVRGDGWVPDTTPSIAYPEESFFGKVLRNSGRRFGTPVHSSHPVCVTAFSSATKELTLRGLGVGWVPFSMVDKELANGDLISLTNYLGKEHLSVAVYADSKVHFAVELLETWSA